MITNLLRIGEIMGYRKINSDKTVLVVSVFNDFVTD
jgi:hypothetical protein